MTSILQIKRSSLNSAPVSLSPGELAYSYVSNTLFIGDSTGNVISLVDNVVFIAANTANAAYAQANLAYIEANTANALAQSAYIQANAANALAANALPITGGSILGSINVSNDAVITGNLTVLGTTTTINTASLFVDENVIYLSANTVGAPVLNNYISVVRGSSPNTFLVWNEVGQEWGWSDDGTNVVSFATVYNLANVANNTATSALAAAAAALSVAEAAYGEANTTLTIAEGAYGEANVANALAQSAFSLANTANVTADAAYAQANLAYAQANAALPASGGVLTGSLLITQNLTVNGVVTMTIDGGSF